MIFSVLIGGREPDWLTKTADKTGGYYSLAPGSSKSITVTQTPRYIMVHKMDSGSITTKYHGGMTITYCEENKTRSLNYNGSANAVVGTGKEVTWSGSQVKITNSGSTLTYWYLIAIWY